MMKTEGPPSWATLREAIAVVVYPVTLRRTLLTALIVGTVLFAINHLDVVVRGEATARTW